MHSTSPRIIGIVAATTLFLSACISFRVPEPQSPEDALIVLTLEKRHAPGVDLFADYEIIFEETTRTIEVESNRTFMVLRGFDPGEYTMVRFDGYMSGTNQRVGQIPIGISFQITEGKVNILPLRIVSFADVDDGRTTQYVNIEPLTREQVDEVIERLSEYENIELWEIAVAPARVAR